MSGEAQFPPCGLKSLVPMTRLMLRRTTTGDRAWLTAHSSQLLADSELTTDN